MGLAPRAEAAAGRIAASLAGGMALAGGAILIAIALLTVASVSGRAVPGLTPVAGDFELVEAGIAVAVFFFLPWCQLRRGHVSVDILAIRLGRRAQAVLGFLGDLAVAVAALVILWRLWLGFGEKFPYGPQYLRDALGMGYKPFFAETTYELQLPVWIPYGLGLIGAVGFFLVALYTVWRSLNWVLVGAEGTP
ncbi:TRAP-type C4-dicarboxylate transport system permease small subunit [Rhodovulum bhavnagarense]|uniref:TRAP transporter small permease protein n=1 Tax=Rhodovulum bhavnagarense TaxID=992286 RepID=A0A4R2RHT8_9RHOB|nr:TRAP transporter small permease [Rhodovulum bhavnagarense]TCP58745.1 TRAP-type C4-dicarboxylate transport system permease small subunit [Rhodovulum bhavnagarense]